MKNGKLCPSCSKDIGLWPVFSAGWPTLIRCPGCKSRLYYRSSKSVFAVLLLVGVALGLGMFFLISWLMRPLSLMSLVIWGVIVLVAWVPIELAVAIFLRNRRELDLVDPWQSER